MQQLSAKEGRQAGEYAACLLARAVRAARPRPAFNSALLKAYAEENRVEESVALCHQVQVCGKARFLSLLGSLTSLPLAKVQTALLDALGL